MDYTAMYLYIYMRCYVSNMVLLVDSDAAYLVMLNAKSRMAEYF